MKIITMPRGTQVLLGRVAVPIPEAISSALTEMIRNIAGIKEAYLPNCYAKGVVEPPAQILVLVLDDASDKYVLDAVGEALARILTDGMHLDVWSITLGDSLLTTVRETKTNLHNTPSLKKKPWWKIL